MACAQRYILPGDVPKRRRQIRRHRQPKRHRIPRQRLLLGDFKGMKLRHSLYRYRNDAGVLRRRPAP